MKKTIIKMTGMEFECKVINYNYGVADVNIHRVIHPNRKFFRTEQIGETYHFDLDRYPTILEGIIKCVARYVEKIEHDNEVVRKINEYENGENENYKVIIIPCDFFEENT